MSNFVFVIDANFQPLDPVHPGQAQRLLKLEKASVYRRYPFTLILKYEVPNPVRATGVFELITPSGKISPVRHKYCKAIHRNDGYSYAF